ncbi:helix-turn-helix domain-containing protein [Lacisediminihabitans sp.]|uniref:helix-turn-helix domain-containing protein n=1 Tax=Lacisediminihabitans sp. TaxID=2787631 RepID=UPI00374D9648
MCADLAESGHDNTARVRGRLATLERFGIAAEPFPSYVNPVLALHGVDVVLLTFVLSGECSEVIGDIEYSMAAPSVGITRTGVKHSLVTGDRPPDVVNVYLDVEYHPLPTLAPPLDVALSALIPFSTAVGSRRARLSQVKLKSLDEVGPLLRMLVTETDNPRDGTGDALDGLRKLLLTACARAILESGLVSAEHEVGSVQSSIQRVRSHLELTYVEHHTLDSLAAMAHLEKTYFSRMFTVHTGLPVTEYLARLRVRYAITQLQGTDRPIAEVAIASGFRDLSHFGRTFRRYTGTTPGSYRRSGPPPAPRV